MTEREGYFEKEWETQEPEERARRQNTWLAETVRYAYEHCETVKEKMDNAKLAPEEIKTEQDLEKMPITPKRDLVKLNLEKGPFGGFLGVDPKDLKRIYISPGPIYDPHGREEDPYSLQPLFYNAGFRKGDRVINTFSYHLTPAGIFCDEAVNALGCVLIPTGVGNTEVQLKTMLDLQVNGYVGVPSFLMGLIKKAEEKGYDFNRDFSMEVAFVAGEILPDSMRRVLEETYHIIVRQGLITADVGGISYECREKNGMHYAENRIVEIVDPETGKQLGPGEIGEIVVTVLGRKDYPLIRLGTGDLSFYEDSPCSCGRTSKRMMKIVGRTDQVTKVRGMFIHPSQVQEVAAAFSEISRVRVTVDRKGDRDMMLFDVLLKESSAASDTLKQKMEEKIREILKLRGDVTFVDKGVIPEDAKTIEDIRKWD